MNNRWTPSVFAKLSFIGLLFSFMLIIVACGGTTNQTTTGSPEATITISFGQFNGSPTPQLQGVYCGGWATDATLPYSTKGVVNVYGKFTQTDKNDNPVGIGAATATATILWPDGSAQTVTTTTSSDGLAVFTIPLQASAINHIVLVQITFVKGNQHCTIPQAAYFTAILASPTASGTPKRPPTPTGTITGTPSGSPTSSPSPFPTLPIFPSPSPKPGH